METIQITNENVVKYAVNHLHLSRKKVIKFLKQTNHPEKAIRICCMLRKNYSKVHPVPSLKEFLNTIGKSEEDAIAIFKYYSSSKKIEITESDLNRKDLVTFCLKNNVDYSFCQSVYWISKIYGKSLEEAIEFTVIKKSNARKRISNSLIQEKYGRFIEQYLKDVITSDKVSLDRINEYLKERVYSLENVLQQSVIIEYNFPLDSYIRGIFCSITNKISFAQKIDLYGMEEFLEKMKSYYFLTREEGRLLENCVREYTDKIYQYQLYDVAFCEQIEKRQSKIQTYGFQEEEILDSFFLRQQIKPDKVLENENLPLKRKRALEYLLLSWNSIDSKVKEQEIEKLPQKEQDYFEKLLEQQEEFTGGSKK